MAHELTNVLLHESCLYGMFIVNYYRVVIDMGINEMRLFFPQGGLFAHVQNYMEDTGMEDNASESMNFVVNILTHLVWRCYLRYWF